MIDQAPPNDTTLRNSISQAVNGLTRPLDFLRKTPETSGTVKVIGTIWLEECIYELRMQMSRENPLYIENVSKILIPNIRLPTNSERKQGRYSTKLTSGPNGYTHGRSASNFSGDLASRQRVNLHGTTALLLLFDIQVPNLLG